MDDLDEIPVLAGDLRTIDRALHAAYGVSAAEDIQQQYRALNGRPRDSALTKALQTALTKVEGYLKEPDEDEEDV